MKVAVGLVVLFLILNAVHSQQNSCSCTCCIGESCAPITLPALSVPACTLTTCIEQCRTNYAQCRTSYPYGVITAQCNVVNIGSQTCRCDCCRGSSTCTPSFVGTTNTYQCQTGACSIACVNQYPTQCVSNQNGQTQGTCITSSTTTTRPPTGNNQCQCNCCNSGSTCFTSYVGLAYASQCSNTACTQACKDQYQSRCPTNLSIGQSYGFCSNATSGSTRCRCNLCFSNTGCQQFELYTGGGCGTCDSTCRQVLSCPNNCEITSSCLSNGTQIQGPFSLGICIFLFLLIFQRIN